MGEFTLIITLFGTAVLLLYNAEPILNKWSKKIKERKVQKRKEIQPYFPEKLIRK